MLGCFSMDLASTYVAIRQLQHHLSITSDVEARKSMSVSLDELTLHLRTITRNTPEDRQAGLARIGLQKKM